MSTESVSQVTENTVQKEFLSEQDKQVLDTAKFRRALAQANAEKAIAQNEVAELQYNNIVLQLTFKYNLKEKDLITEQGEIKRNAGDQ